MDLYSFEKLTGMVITEVSANDFEKSLMKIYSIFGRRVWPDSFTRQFDVGFAFCDVLVYGGISRFLLMLLGAAS